MKLSGYVLAGGQSARMGRDKSLLRLGDHTLLEIALNKLKQVCSDVSILCGSAAHGEALAAYGRVVTDRTPNSGPLSGLDAALHDAREDTVLLMAVDTPLLSLTLLQQLARMDEAACFEVDGFIQPLPMRITKIMHPAVEEALATNNLKLLPLLHKLGLQTIPVKDTSLFANLNTPEEFAVVHETIQQNESRKGASE